jgi:hypothetical protein
MTTIARADAFRVTSGPLGHYPYVGTESVANVVSTAYLVGDPRRYAGAAVLGGPDARDAIAAADTVPGQYVRLASGSWTVASNLTITSGIQFDIGAKLKPSAGVTITINGPILAPLTQIFDLSAGGTIVFGPDAAERLFVKWFGADSTGSIDCTSAAQAAVNACTYGGVVWFTAGKYKFLGEVTLHAGITVQGDSAVDFAYGAPPNYGNTPSYLFQGTAGKAIFIIRNGMMDITVRKLAFGATLSPTPGGTTPTLDDKKAIKIQGCSPGFIWNLNFEDLLFYQPLHWGIHCEDPSITAVTRANSTAYTLGTWVKWPTGTDVFECTVAGTTAASAPSVAGITAVGQTLTDGTVTWICRSLATGYDWSVAPVTIRRCRFYYPYFGIFVNTNNADLWLVEQCFFFVPSGGDGAWLFRFGLFNFVSCSAAGSFVSSNHFVHVTGAGVGGVDRILLDSCQAETLTQALYLDTGGTYTTQPFVITIRNCVNELGSDIYLGNRCRLISENNRYWANVYVDNPNVRITSRDDEFDTGHQFRFLGATDASMIFEHLIPGTDTAPIFAADVRVKGLLTRRVAGVTTPTTETFKAGDRIVNDTPTVGQPKAKVCTVAGGATSTTRANSTAYAGGVWATWTTGTTAWEVTTAGTSAAAPPSIVGLVVGNTVTDGTVVWTLRSLTTATFASEGNL